MHSLKTFSCEPLLIFCFGVFFRVLDCSYLPSSKPRYRYQLISYIVLRDIVIMSSAVNIVLSTEVIRYPHFSTEMRETGDFCDKSVCPLARRIRQCIDKKE